MPEKKRPKRKKQSVYYDDLTDEEKAELQKELDEEAAKFPMPPVKHCDRDKFKRDDDVPF